MILCAFLLGGVVMAADPDKAPGVTEKGPVPMNVEPGRFQQATVVLRVKLRQALGGDKYAWYRVQVLKVLKIASEQKIGETLDVAALSSSPGVSKEECTIYLEPYNTTKDHPWKLLGGSAAQGVSHVVAPFVGFPVLPPIPNADPSIRREQSFRLPTRLKIKRTDDQIAVAVDPDFLQTVKMEVGANMLTGLKSDLIVTRGGKEVLSGYSGLQGVSGNTVSDIGTVILNRKIDKIPQPGEKYTVRVRLSLFETNIPAQHMWSPESGKYRVLWTKTLQQEVE